MSNRSSAMSVLYVLMAALLLAPLALLAQEDEASLGKSAVQAKLAIELGAPFGDNMILQREMDLPVWGWSKPGTKITVEFAPRPGSGQAGQKATAEAGKDGKWTLKLKPLKANAEPAEMIITDSDGKKVVLKNVLVGEVWMASGQSNMQWKVGKCDVAALLKRVAESVAAGKEKQPVIREFEVSSVFSALHPIEHAVGAWKNGDLENYSAVATAFAYELYKELGVPIGILNCSFSQTAIQAWTPRCGFRDGKDEYTQAIYKKILESDPATPEHKAAWDKYYQEIETAVKEGKAISTATPGNLSDNRSASWMYHGRLHPVIPYAIRGAIWNQGYANIGEGFLYYNNLHSLIRGWREVWGQGEFPVYFHQFYAPGANDGLTLNEMAEMRLGAWMARDIPNTGMGCQIDITGAIHYADKAVPGKRLALHALKNQYSKKIVTDGPMFKSYAVKGEKLIVELEHTDGGLLVGQMTPGKTLDGPAVIEKGEEKVTLFYLADKDRVWHRAKLKIAGDKVELTAAGVTEPRGVAYGCNGIGSQPNIYNKAMLPLAPFIYYDNKLVTSKDWPDNPIKVEGVTVDPSTVGKRAEYHKMPLLAQQFRDNAVLQADMPVTFWGSAVHAWSGYEEKGKAEIKFSFASSTGSGQAGIEKTIPVTPGMKEWQVVVPPMKASAEPKTLKVTFSIDGEVAHERVCTNMVVGDVWYVAVPPMAVVKADSAAATDLVRVMARKASRDRSSNPARFSVSVSTLPNGTGASRWENAKDGLAALLGQRIAAKTGKPVGIIFMQSASGKDLAEPELKYWIDVEALGQVPSLAADDQELKGIQPGTTNYAANAKNYIAAWKKYWSEYIPTMIAEKRVPDEVPWGKYPSFGGKITTAAAQSYNVLTCSFTPASVKGIIFLTSETMFKQDQGANFGEQFAVMANSWKEKFACPDAAFFYTVPSATLAPKITKPKGIKGQSTAIEIAAWPAAKAKKEEAAAFEKQMNEVIEKIVGSVYR
jgi:sialate O-acetylesterase